MSFNSSNLVSLIIEPLRYLFTNYAGGDLTWNSDHLKTKIVIDEIDNFNNIPLQVLPRILVTRGQFSINPVSLTDNLSESNSISELKGASSKLRFLTVEGVAQVLLEANNKGTLERMVDLTSKFLAWSGPVIANSKGFKKFGLPLAISSCTPGRDDKEIFQCTINVPWIKEEHFKQEEQGKVLMGLVQVLNLVT